MLFSLSGLAQKNLTEDEVKSNYKKLATYYNGDYSFRATYRSYLGFNSSIVADKQQGYFSKRGEVTVASLLGTYTVQNEDIKLSIDSVERMIAISYPDTLQKMMFFDEQQYNLSKQRIASSYIEKSRDADLMSFEFKPGFQYSKVSLLILPNGMLKEIAMYFSDQVEYEDDQGKLQKDNLKVLIGFETIKTSQKDITPQDVVVKTATGYGLREGFKEFELIDLRYQSN